MEEELKKGAEIAQERFFEVNPQSSNRETPFLILAKDPGAANCLSPVINALSERDRHIFIFTKDTAEEIFNQKFSQQSQVSKSTPESVVLKETPIILASGTSDPEYEGNIITKLKKTNPKLKLILIEDFPGSLVSITKKLATFNITPDLALVTSRSSQKNMNQRFPNFGKEKVIPVGQPAFDSLLLEETKTVNQEIRKKLGLTEDDLLVTYSGVPSQDHPNLNYQALELIISALNSIANDRGLKINFVNRNHPREVNPSQFIPILENASANVKIIDETQHQKISTRDITAVSNLVATTISTTGLEAVLRGCRPQTKLDQTGWMPIHILLPQAQDFIKRTAGSLPVIKFGATAIAWNEAEVRNAVEKSLFDEGFKKGVLNAQQGPLRNEYRFYGKKTSTDRVLLWLRYFEKKQRKIQ